MGLLAAQLMGSSLTLTGYAPAAHVVAMTTSFDDTQHLPLKEMDGLLLAQTILATDELGGARNLINRAIRFASYYHRHQTRASRGPLPRTHYIEHPLRVCLRLMRWGVDDHTVLVAAVLHDVVEDCADEIQADYNEPAIDVVEDLFGAAVAGLVAMLTNPESVAGATLAERNAQYVEHVALVIGDPFVLLVKFSDFTDNALSLHHHTHIDGMTQRLAQKYLPLVPIFRGALESAVDLQMGTPVGDAASKMLIALEKNRLAELAAS